MSVTFNDGFCDLCHVFRGHEDLLVGRCPLGKFLACSECREKIESLKTVEEKKEFISNGPERRAHPMSALRFKETKWMK